MKLNKNLTPLTESQKILVHRAPHSDKSTKAFALRLAQKMISTYCLTCTPEEYLAHCQAEVKGK